MPIYVYRCQECNEYTEAMQKASDPPLKTCSHCAAEALMKVIAPVGVVFKGSGFHKNDYSGKASAGSSEKKSESKTTESAAPVAETKSESKSESGTSEKKSNGGDKVA